MFNEDLSVFLVVPDLYNILGRNILFHFIELAVCYRLSFSNLLKRTANKKLWKGKMWIGYSLSN